MSVLENGIEPAPIPQHTLQQRGFRAYRDILDHSVIETAQAALFTQFGGAAIGPLHNEDLSSQATLLGTRETARALIANDLGTAEVMRTVAGDLPQRTTLGFKARASRFSVHDFPTKNSKGTIMLRFGTDSHLASHRGLITDIIDDESESPHDWNKYRSVVPIARLMDSPTMEAVRGFRLPKPIVVQFGHLMLKRNGKPARRTADLLD
jgi:hypothetical protein